MALPGASVSDAAGVADTPTVRFSAAVSVSDSSVAGEDGHGRGVGPAGVSASDAASVAESVTVQVVVSGVRLVNVSDAATVGETVTVGALALPGPVPQTAQA